MVRFRLDPTAALIWTAALLVSEAPGLLAQALCGESDRFFGWLQTIIWCQLAGVLILTACTFALPRLRAGRDSLLMMAAFFLGWVIIGPRIFDAPTVRRWAIENVGLGWAHVLDRLRLLIPAILMTAIVLGRYRCSDLFLAWGRFSAPVRWSVLFPFPVRTWTMMLAIGLLLAVALLGALLVQTIRFDWSRADRLVTELPKIVVAAFFNAAAEEYVFRMLFLAVLIPAVGPRQAIAITAIRFGLGHWHGQPSGPLGVAAHGIRRLGPRQEHGGNAGNWLGVLLARLWRLDDLQFAGNGRKSNARPAQLSGPTGFPRKMRRRHSARFLR